MTATGDIYGTVFQGATAIFLARVLGYDGQPVLPAQIASARYTVARLDDDDPTLATPVTGHSDVSLTPSQVLFASLQKDALWEEDEVGYNFRHVVEVAQYPAFTEPGSRYRVEYRLFPTANQIIVVRFRVQVI